MFLSLLIHGIFKIRDPQLLKFTFSTITLPRLLQLLSMKIKGPSNQIGTQLGLHFSLQVDVIFICLYVTLHIWYCTKAYFKHYAVNQLNKQFISIKHYLTHTVNSRLIEITDMGFMTNLQSVF